MKFFSLLPVAFCVAVQALPAALPEPAAAPAPIADLAPAFKTAPAPLAGREEFEKRASVLDDIEKGLKKLKLTLTSTTEEVVGALGLTTASCTVYTLMSKIVDASATTIKTIDADLAKLFKAEGLADPVKVTVGDVDDALGLTSADSIGNFLHKLGL